MTPVRNASQGVSYLTNYLPAKGVVNPLAISPAGFLSIFTKLVAGENYTAAITNDGMPLTWGNNLYGTLGTGGSTIDDQNVPVQPADHLVMTVNNPVIAINTSENTSRFLKSDGTVWNCGNNSWGQLGDNTTFQRTTPVQARKFDGFFLSDIIAIGGGSTHSLAVKADGTVWAWGRNSQGQLGDNTVLQRLRAIQVLGPGGIGFLTNAIAVAGGSTLAGANDHSLALKTDGSVWAWGNNLQGQLGDNTTTERHTPVQVLGTGGIGFLEDVIAIAAKKFYSMALKTDGSVWAWGSNTFGRLGDNTTTQRNAPVQVLGPGGIGFLEDIIVIAAGDNHALALKTDGSVWAWGNNNSGQLGDNSTTERHTPVQVLGPGGIGFLEDIIAIAAGFNHSLALKIDGSVWAWGNNGSGRLGDNTTTERHTPVQVLNPEGTGFLDNVTAIAAGGEHSMAISPINLAWGRSNNGQLGNGSTATKMIPYPVIIQVIDYSVAGLLTDCAHVSSFADNTLVAKNDGSVWGWGRNNYGEIGDGTRLSSLPLMEPIGYKRNGPVQTLGLAGVGFLEDVSSIITGYNNTIAIKNDGSVWAWGENGDGQLGVGDTTDRLVPTQMLGLNGVGFLENPQQIVIGDGVTLVLMPDGSVWITGNDGYSQFSEFLVPALGPGGLETITDAVAIAIGDYHNLVLKSDATVWAWGDNWAGQLGTGDFLDSDYPVEVTGLDEVAAVNCGEYCSYAIKFDGSLYAWGWNLSGILGDGTDTDRNVPTQVVGPGGVDFLQDVIWVCGGISHSLALKSDGSVWAWGENWDGELGIGEFSEGSFVPVQVLGKDGVGLLNLL